MIIESKTAGFVARLRAEFVENPKNKDNFYLCCDKFGPFYAKITNPHLCIFDSVERAETELKDIDGRNFLLEPSRTEFDAKNGRMEIVPYLTFNRIEVAD